jgi:4-methylaminobutanoate oxidase (formaldehyde-forming)
VALSKPGGFTGCEALLQQKEQGLNRRLVQFALDDPEPLLYHNEPIWRNGRIVGRITSGMFGHTLGKSLGMGYVTNSQGVADRDFIMEARYEIEVAGVRVPASASLAPLYDPTGLRVKDVNTATPGATSTRKPPSANNCESCARSRT